MGRFIVHRPVGALNVMVAVVLAFGACELILRVRNPRPTMVEKEPSYSEPSRRLDPRLGWVFVPSRTGRDNIGGRFVEYAVDSAGYRVRRVDEPVDPDQPTIVFAGESMMFGEGLTWDETIPARTGAIMGIQSANFSLSGFTTYQPHPTL